MEEEDRKSVCGALNPSPSFLARLKESLKPLFRAKFIYSFLLLGKVPQFKKNTFSINLFFKNSIWDVIHFESMFL